MMGLFTKSVFILALAVATPLVYRQFVDDSAVKYLSSHVTNYKVIDQFLRQSAAKLDNAKQYINKDTAKQVHHAIDTHVRPHIEPIIKSIPGYISALKDKLGELSKTVPTAASKSDSKSSKQKMHDKPAEKQAKVSKKDANHAEKAKKPLYRTVNCPKDKSSNSKATPVRLWTKSELEKRKTDEILLSFMGIVYNVTAAGKSYYAPGKEYSIFAGRDATRAYLTGNFTHDLSDNISDLDESTYGDLKNWSSFYEQSYPQVGLLEGQYYDSQGCPTAETQRIYMALAKLSQEAEKQKEESIVLPECNSEWNADTKKSRVWCSKSSGGVERSWAGVPRIYVNDKSNSQQCICYSEESKVDAALAKKLKVYPGCQIDAQECNLAN